MSILKQGMKGQAVKSLQQALKRAGFGDGLKISGSFDEATETAVQAFQKKMGLRADGRATGAVMETLGRVPRRGIKPLRPQIDYSPFLKREDDAFRRVDIKHKRMLSILMAMPAKAYDPILAEVRSNRDRHRASYMSWRDTASRIVKSQYELAKIAQMDPARAQDLTHSIANAAETAKVIWHQKRAHVVQLEEVIARFQSMRNAEIS
ncbi:MAG: peptidoglycan-binding domain-containing protein [Pseudomonadota bacterium]